MHVPKKKEIEKMQHLSKMYPAGADWVHRKHWQTTATEHLQLMPFHKLTNYRLTYPAPKKLTFLLSLLLTVPLPFITVLPSERQPPSLLCVANAWLVSRKAARDIQLATTGILLR